MINPLEKIDNSDLEIWYRLQEINDNIIKDSSKNSLNGSINGNLEIVNVNDNSITNEYKIIQNNFKAIKINNSINGIETPVKKLNTFTLMIKVNLIESTDLINIINYNNLNIKINSNQIKIFDNNTLLETSEVNFINNWKAIILIYNNNKLSVYIDSKLILKNINLIISDSTNKFKLISDTEQNININLEDFRIYSKIVSYQTIYKYSNGLIIL